MDIKAENSAVVWVKKFRNN